MHVPIKIAQPMAAVTGLISGKQRRNQNETIKGDTLFFELGNSGVMFV